MKIIETTTKQQYEIFPTKSGENVICCPACEGDRKKKAEKTMTWNNQKGTGHCWRDKCQAKFVIMNEDYKPKEYKLPEPLPEIKAYSEKLAAYFMSRGLFESTMKRFAIAEGEHFFP